MSAFMAFLHHLAAWWRSQSSAYLFATTLFVLIALASIYPTVKFLGWRKSAPDPATVPAIRRILHLELIGVAIILLAAALMAKGIG
jgi:putative membrane protein